MVCTNQFSMILTPTFHKKKIAVVRSVSWTDLVFNECYFSAVLALDPPPPLGCSWAWLRRQRLPQFEPLAKRKPGTVPRTEIDYIKKTFFWTQKKEHNRLSNGALHKQDFFWGKEWFHQKCQNDTLCRWNVSFGLQIWPLFCLSESCKWQTPSVFRFFSS